MTNKNIFFFVFSTNNKFLYTYGMGASERFPVSLNAVNVVCFKIDWEERMLNVLLVKRSICLLYTSPSPRDKRQSRMPSSA